MSPAFLHDSVITFAYQGYFPDLPHGANHTRQAVCWRQSHTKEMLNQLVCCVVRQAHHERNQLLAVRPEPVEGLVQLSLKTHGARIALPTRTLPIESMADVHPLPPDDTFAAQGSTQGYFGGILQSNRISIPLNPCPDAVAGASLAITGCPRHTVWMNWSFYRPLLP